MLGYRFGDQTPHHKTTGRPQQVATKTADRSLLPPAPAKGVLAPGAWVLLRRGGRSFKGALAENMGFVGYFFDVFFANLFFVLRFF